MPNITLVKGGPTIPETMSKGCSILNRIYEGGMVYIFFTTLTALYSLIFYGAHQAKKSQRLTECKETSQVL